MDNAKHSIRNLDKDLILEARIYGLQSGETLGEVVNRSLESFLYEDGDLGDSETQLGARSE